MMYSASLIAALFASANAHGVILAAVGEKGSPTSVGFQVDPALARNCTGISPCQQDTTIIRDAEINTNVVNECGRTELTGNIDVGENTENALAAGAVTLVKAGTIMSVTIHQVNADEAGPYVCDLDQTSNAGIISQNLTVTNNVPGVNGLSQAKTEDFTINVAMPENLACTGASTGNVCTVRCRNNAVAGPFGGCFAVQQTDITQTVNSANTITTAQDLKAVNDQVAQNVKDLPVAVAANAAQGDPEVQKGAQVAAGTPSSPRNDSGLLSLTPANCRAGECRHKCCGCCSCVETSSVATAKTGKTGNGGKTAAAATSQASASTATTKKGKNNNKRGSVLKWAKRMVDSNSS